MDTIKTKQFESPETLYEREIIRLQKVIEEKDHEIKVLTSTANVQYKLMVNAEQRGVDKAKEELEDKDIKMQAFELAFGDKVKEVERLKGLIEAAFHYTPRLNTHWEQFKTDNNL